MTIVTTITNGFNYAVSGVQNTASNLLNGAVTKAGNVWSSVQPYLSSVYKGITNRGFELLGYIRGFIDANQSPSRTTIAVGSVIALVVLFGARGFCAGSVANKVKTQ